MTCPFCGSTDVADTPTEHFMVCLDCDRSWFRARSNWIACPTCRQHPTLRSDPRCDADELAAT